MKHTPGPWYWIEGGRNDMPILTSDAGRVCHFGNNRSYYPNEGDPPEEPDAQLIAAAPDLLEAVKLVIAWYEAEDDHSKADFYQRIEMCRESEAACRAAIAKATGESQ
jgi:hypothetical protein